MAGLGIGGAAAPGLQAGFYMGLRADDAAERKRIATVAEQRNAGLDAERQAQTLRTNARQDKADADNEDDRALKALDIERQDHAYEGARLAQQYGGPDKIPGEIGSTYAAKAGEIGTRRAALLRRRYAPVVEKEQQWAKDTASRIQTGQMSMDDLSPADTVRLLQATTRRPVTDFLAPAGGKSKVGQGVADTTAGLKTKNQGLVVQGAGVLLSPELQTGLGHVTSDGSEIVRKDLYALVPAMPQPGGMRAPAAPQGNPVQGLSAALTNVMSDTPAQPQQEPPPSAVMPVLQVTARHPDGKEVTYHAPVTKGRGVGPADEVHPGIQLSDAMDQVGKLGALEAWANTPAARAKIEQGLKELGGGANDFLGAYYAMHGDARALLPPGSEDPTSKKIAAVQKLAKEQFGGDFAAAMRAFDGKASGGAVQQKLDAIEASDLSDADKAKATKVALMGTKASGIGGGSGGGGSSAGTSAALGGAAPPAGGNEADTVDFWARAVIAGDRDWQVGISRSKSGSALIEKVKRRVPELAKQMGLDAQDIGTTRAQNAALAATLKELTKRGEAVDLFASKVEKDMKTFDGLLDKAALDSPLLLNQPINYLRRKFSDAALAQLDLAAQQVGAEYERLITGGALSVAQLHVGAQEDAKKLINGDMPPKQARAIMQTMLVEMKNAREAAHESRTRVTDQMRGLGRGTEPAPGPAAAPGGAKPAAPAVGTVQQGYRFKGGNPADKANWEKQ